MTQSPLEYFHSGNDTPLCEEMLQYAVADTCQNVDLKMASVTFMIVYIDVLS